MYRSIGFVWLCFACATVLALLPARVDAQAPDAPDAFGRVAGESGARLVITPRDAEVYVDGERVGIVDDFDGITQRLRVPSGEHELDLYADGYRTFHRKVRFERGETYRIEYSMQPLGTGEVAEPPPTPRQQPHPAAAHAAREEAASDTFGTLSIRVQPADATVIVDNERWNGSSNEARLVVTLGEGTHRVEIQRDGYRSYAGSVRIQRGDVTSLNVILPKQER